MIIIFLYATFQDFPPGHKTFIRPGNYFLSASPKKLNSNSVLRSMIKQKTRDKLIGRDKLIVNV
ncbi:MAG: hypothetical protein AB1611_02285 [bacterium]